MVGATKSKRQKVTVVSKTKISVQITKQQRLYASIPGQTVTLKRRIAAALGGGNPPQPIIYCVCPECFEEMNEEEVEEGFTDNVGDFTTQCPCCGTRFETSGTINLNGRIERFVLLCESQTQNELKHWAKAHDLFIDYLVDKLLKERPELAWNAYRHCKGHEPCGECGHRVEMNVTEAVREMLK